MKKTEGFTLIELLVVIAIIGLLATLAVVSFQGAQSKARDTKRKADLLALSKAIELYYDENGNYPMNGGWCTQISHPTYIAAFAAAIAPWLAVIPYDPSFEGTYQDYLYRNTNDQTYYLYAELEGEDRGSDNFSGCTRIDGTNNEYDYRIPTF